MAQKNELHSEEMRWRFKDLVNISLTRFMAYEHYQKRTHTTGYRDRKDFSQRGKDIREQR